jgi:hypothetical protein
MLQAGLHETQRAQGPGGTVNAVLLTAVAGGLRTWLGDRRNPLNAGCALGEHGADEVGQGAVGEDADDVGAAADIAVEPLLGLFEQFSRELFGSGVTAAMSRRSASCRPVRVRG